MSKVASTVILYVLRKTLPGIPDTPCLLGSEISGLILGDPIKPINITHYVCITSWLCKGFAHIIVLIGFVVLFYWERRSERNKIIEAYEGQSKNSYS
jgi:uncharacterized membrane protein SirB2